MIHFEGVSKKYGEEEVVRDLTFTIPAHHTFVLLGKSGSGKTTTLKMINRLEGMTTGSIKIHDQSIESVPAYELRRSIGYVIQSTGLFPHMDVYENIATVPKLLGWDKQQIDLRVEELLEKVGLNSEYANRRPDELSGGQKQRIGLARALASKPDILLMDEPFGALDPIIRQDIQNMFLSIESIANKTVVLVTHDVIEAFMMGDQICLFDNGNIEQIGTPSELLRSPNSSKVSSFFDSKRSELEMEVFTFQDIYIYLNQYGFPFNSYPFPPNLSLGAILKNLDMLKADLEVKEMVYKAFLRYKQQNN